MRSSIITASARRTALLRFAQSASPVTSTTGPHPIAAVQAFQMDEPGKSWVVLRVRTQSGLTGYGECNTISPADLKLTNQAILGRACSAYQALDGLVPPTVRGGLNIALLDLLGKAINAPIYRVLGGPTRNKARAITRLAGSSDEELQNDLHQQLATGFRAFLIPIPSPAARNQGSDFAHHAVARLTALRTAAQSANFAVDFAYEGLSQLTPADAATLAGAMQAMHPLWFDEPCPVSNLETLRKIAEETVVPLGFGRTLSDPTSGPGTFQDLLREGVVDLLRPDLLTYGITGVRRLAAIAETYYVDVAPWHGGGVIANAAALHAAASIPNFFIAQTPNPHQGAAPHNGFFDLPAGPGLGIAVDEKNFERNSIA